MNYAFGEPSTRDGRTTLVVVVDGYHVGWIDQSAHWETFFDGQPVVFRPNYCPHIGPKKAQDFGLWMPGEGTSIAAHSIEEAKTKIRRILRRG